MDYIERKTVLKQAKKALEAGGVDIDQFLVACEQEIVNSKEVDKCFLRMGRHVSYDFQEDFDYNQRAVPKTITEAIGKGLYGKG